MINNFHNETLKLYKNFLIENNIFNEESFNKGKQEYLIANLFKNTFDNDAYMNISKDNLEINCNWRNYYLKYSVEFKIFLRFLKENNIYQKFMNNLIKQNNPLYDTNFIRTTIAWINTKEGHSYWRYYSTKWENFKESCKNIINF